jgi:hypothetical protein
MSDNPEYVQGYLEGYTDAEKHYTDIFLSEYDRGYNDAKKLLAQPSVSCGYEVEWNVDI